MYKLVNAVGLKLKGQDEIPGISMKNEYEIVKNNQENFKMINIVAKYAKTASNK